MKKTNQKANGEQKEKAFFDCPYKEASCRLYGDKPYTYTHRATERGCLSKNHRWAGIGANSKGLESSNGHISQMS